MVLNSFGFVSIVLAAFIACRLSDSLVIRQIALAMFSILFLSSYITELQQILVLAGFLVIIYVIGYAKAKATNSWPSIILLSIVSVIWTALFLLKDPNLLSFINPFNARPIAIVGISYVVFRGITYIMEISTRDKLNPMTFVNYMLFFPTLLAGPIERYHKFEKNMVTPLSFEGIGYDSLNRVLNGFIKKFVIADNLWDMGIFSMMSSGQDISAPVLWLGALSMLALVYLDFSGYSDIVIGIAKIMGFKIVENFNKPFEARNLQEFWGRWHISLGSVIQDYVFSPLSKVVMIKMHRSMQVYGIAVIYVLAMVLVAMWHGTTFGFLIFGVSQGLVLFAIQIWSERSRAALKKKGIKISSIKPSKTRIWMGRIATYSFVSVSMIWWQSSVSRAIEIYGILLGLR